MKTLFAPSPRSQTASSLEASQDKNADAHGELARALDEVLRIAAGLGISRALPPVLTVEQAAELLNVDKKTVYVAVQRRVIPGVRRFGRTVRISTEALMGWLAKGRGEVAR